MANHRWLALMSLLMAGCGDAVVAHQLAEREANEMVMVLGDHSIQAAARRDEGRDLRFDVLVPKDKSHAALRVLHDAGLPKRVYVDTEALLKDRALIPNSTDEQLRRIVAIQGDIANALRSIPGVIDVRVIASIPPDDPLPEPNIPEARPKVSIVLGYQANAENLAPITAADVQRAAQAAVSELQTGDVEVLMVPNRAIVSAPLAPAPMTAMCQKARILGLDVCSASRSSFFTILIAVALAGALLSVVSIFSTLRAFHYREDLTRLTAQLATARK